MRIYHGYKVVAALFMAGCCVAGLLIPAQAAVEPSWQPETSYGTEGAAR